MKVCLVLFSVKTLGKVKCFKQIKSNSLRRYAVLLTNLFSFCILKKLWNALHVVCDWFTTWLKASCLMVQRALLCDSGKTGVMLQTMESFWLMLIFIIIPVLWCSVWELQVFVVVLMQRIVDAIDQYLGVQRWSL